VWKLRTSEPLLRGLVRPPPRSAVRPSGPPTGLRATRHDQASALESPRRPLRTTPVVSAGAELRCFPSTRKRLRTPCAMPLWYRRCESTTRRRRSSGRSSTAPRPGRGIQERRAGGPSAGARRVRSRAGEAATRRAVAEDRGSGRIGRVAPCGSGYRQRRQGVRDRGRSPCLGCCARRS
jgi:hypothetical protein